MRPIIKCGYCHSDIVKNAKIQNNGRITFDAKIICEDETGPLIVMMKRYKGVIKAMSVTPYTLTEVKECNKITFNVSPLNDDFEDIIAIIIGYGADIIDIRKGDPIGSSPHNINYIVITVGINEYIRKLSDELMELLPANNIHTIITPKNKKKE